MVTTHSVTVSFDVVDVERTDVARTSRYGRYEGLVVNVDEEVRVQGSDRTSRETTGCRKALKDACLSPEWRPAHQILTSAAVKPPSLGLMVQAPSVTLNIKNGRLRDMAPQRLRESSPAPFA